MIIPAHENTYFLSGTTFGFREDRHVIVAWRMEDNVAWPVLLDNVVLSMNEGAILHPNNEVTDLRHGLFDSYENWEDFARKDLNVSRESVGAKPMKTKLIAPIEYANPSADFPLASEMDRDAILAREDAEREAKVQLRELERQGVIQTQPEGRVITELPATVTMGDVVQVKRKRRTKAEMEAAKDVEDLV